jgi:hypothetical protein
MPTTPAPDPAQPSPLPPDPVPPSPLQPGAALLTGYPAELTEYTADLPRKS